MDSPKPACRSLLYASSRFRSLVRAHSSSGSGPDDFGELFFCFIYYFKRRSLTRTLPFRLEIVKSAFPPKNAPNLNLRQRSYFTRSTKTTHILPSLARDTLGYTFLQTLSNNSSSWSVLPLKHSFTSKQQLSFRMTASVSFVYLFHHYFILGTKPRLQLYLLPRLVFAYKVNTLD